MPPSKRTIGLSELRVGLFVVIGIFILIFLILNASGDINPFARKLHLRARFANADGLRPGAEVRLAGVRVGKVDEVKLLPPSNKPDDPKVVAVLAIDNTIDGQPANQRIRTDSTVSLGSPSLLGNDKIISISAGTAAGQPVAENHELLSSEIKQSTLSNLVGPDVADQFTGISKNLNEITRKINEGNGTLGRIVNDEALYNSLNEAIIDTQAVIRQIRSGQGSAGRFINDPAIYNNVNDLALRLNDIAEGLRSGRGTAGKLLTDEALYNRINSIANRVDASVNDINSMIADVRAGRGTLGKLLTDEAIYTDARTAIARFNSTAERVDSVVSAAQRGEGTVGKLLTDEQLYNNVNQFSSEAVKLIYDFRQNPKKYLTIKFELF
ncbi:MAG TPA: MlaD family protein [Pyrinomonadaceae bacterium]|jgi:phospholipid/cholesterol/gamma-HCH transport system substrate-binding protein